MVSFEVDDGTVLPAGTRSGIRWRNVLGQKYLYLYPGEPGELAAGEPLEPGDRIPIEQSVPSADVGDFLNAVGPVLQALDPDDANAFVQAVSEGVSGNEAAGPGAHRRQRAARLGPRAASTARSARSSPTSTRWPTAVAQRDDALDELLVNLSSLSGDLAGRNQSLNTLITDFTDVQHRLERAADARTGVTSTARSTTSGSSPQSLAEQRRRPRGGPGHPPRGCGARTTSSPRRVSGSVSGPRWRAWPTR